MAWRIDEAVVRGEIDNRTRGKVTGRLWFVGRDEPVVLELDGDCHRDLAGRRLEFSNREPKAADLKSFAAMQRGSTGDITASRKVRVPEIPMDQIGEYYAAKKPFPWHWGNSLYLEWYSQTNGRVVIESASYDLRIVGDAHWEMTAAEEETQRSANAAAMDGFLEQLARIADDEQRRRNKDGAASKQDGEGNDAPRISDFREESLDLPELNADDEGDEDDDDEFVVEEAEDDEDWDITPLTEAEAEQLEADRDKLADRIRARLEREGENANFEQIIEEEIARLRRERGDPEPTPEQRARNAQWLAEMEEAANDLAEEALEDGLEDMSHPLSEQTYNLAVRVMKDTEEFGWQDETAGEEHPVAELLHGVMVAGAKLAGALDGEEWPPDLEFSAAVIVRLKKARTGVDDALRAADACAEQNLTDGSWLHVVRAELNDIGESIDALIAELRGRFERGCE